MTGGTRMVFGKAMAYFAPVTWPPAATGCCWSHAAPTELAHRVVPGLGHLAGKALNPFKNS